MPEVAGPWYQLYYWALQHEGHGQETHTYTQEQGPTCSLQAKAYWAATTAFQAT